MLTIDQYAALFAFFMLSWLVFELWPAIRTPVNKTVHIFCIGLLLIAAAWILRSAFWDGFNAYLKQYNYDLVEHTRHYGSFVVNPIVSVMLGIGAGFGIRAVRRAKRGEH